MATTYTPEPLLISNGLDELGFRLGLTRIEGESLGDYRRRLYLEARDPSGASQKDFFRGISRRVGLFDTPVARVQLVMDSSGPLAPDPFIQVTSTHLRVWSDLENDTLDLEVNFVDRDEGYWVGQVLDAIDALAAFEVEHIDPDYRYRRSTTLRYSDSDSVVFGEPLKRNRVNTLQHGLLKDVRFTSFQHFANEVASPDQVLEPGDYYVDPLEGVVWSAEPAAGYVTYARHAFPFTLVSQAVRAWPLNDEDSKYLFYDTILEDTTGEPDYLLLNPKGAAMFNQVLRVHPLEWGK